MPSKFLRKKLNARTKKMMELTTTERDLLDIYEEAIGRKRIVGKGLEKINKFIRDLLNTVGEDFKTISKRKDLTFLQRVKIGEFEDTIKQNEENLDMLNRLFFIQDRIEADADLKARKMPLIAPPWMNYCGEKTKIAENIRDNVAPTDRVDALCKQHDIDFDLANSPEEAREADLKLLKSLDELGNKKLGYVESFNRELVKLMISNKKTLEDIGVLPFGSFADIDKRFSEKQIEVIKEIGSDTQSIVDEMEEFIFKTEGFKENELEFILEELIQEKGDEKLVSPNEFRDRVYDRLSKISNLKMFQFGKVPEIIDNFIQDIYIKRQQMPPKTKSARGRVRDEVEALIKAGTKLEDFPVKYLNKGSIGSGQLTKLIMEHNNIRIGKDKLNRKKMRINTSGSIESRLERVNEVISSLKDGIDASEKGGVDDWYISMLQKISDGVTLTVKEDERMVEAQRAMGKAKTLKLKAEFEAEKAKDKKVTDEEKAKEAEDKAREVLRQKELADLRKKELEAEALAKAKAEAKAEAEAKAKAEAEALARAEAEAKAKAEKTKKITPVITKINKAKVKVKKQLPKKVQFKNQKADELVDLANGLTSRPTILDLLRRGTIGTSDVSKLGGTIKGLAKILRDAKVVFEGEEQAKIGALIEQVEKDLDSLSPDMDASDFNIQAVLIQGEVRAMMDKLIEEEEEEEGEQKDIIEEKERRSTQPFQEQKIQPSFSLQQKGDIASSVAVESKEKASPIEDKLKTSTDRGNNNLPRQRRPFFFTLGTDLITKTAEENEEDIETFADFSWIPVDGNFYNGETNSIVRANNANDIIRYDLNNQFGGLWMPEAPQPIFKLTPSNPLYEKLRVSLAPVIQHEQKRMNINERANPGRIKLYSQHVLGATDEIRRNNIDNRDIFPNVVDGMRV